MLVDPAELHNSIKASVKADLVGSSLSCGQLDKIAVSVAGKLQEDDRRYIPYAHDVSIDKSRQ